MPSGEPRLSCYSYSASPSWDWITGCIRCSLSRGSDKHLVLNTAPEQLYLLSIALLQMNTMYLMLEEITSRICTILYKGYIDIWSQALHKISARLLKDKSGIWMYFNLRTEIPESLLPTTGLKISLCDFFFYFWKVCCYKVPSPGKNWVFQMNVKYKQQILGFQNIYSCGCLM